MSRKSQQDNADLSQQDVEEILHEWSRGFFRKRKIGKLTIEKVEQVSCFIIRGITQFENREILTVEEPYFDGEIDNSGPSPNKWNIRLPRPGNIRNFINGTSQIKVPHSEKVCTCETCLGEGHTTCQFCDGNGELYCQSCSGSGVYNCNVCGGNGQELQTVYDQVYSADGQPRQEIRTVIATCPGCGGAGTFTCEVCNGSRVVDCLTCQRSGILECETCKGQGRVKKFKRLVVTFEARRDALCIGSVDIEDEILFEASGKSILNKSDNEIIEIDADEMPDRRLADHALEFIQSFEKPNARKHFQTLQIDDIPAFRISYKKNSFSKEKYLWIYGNEREIYFEGQSSSAVTKNRAKTKIALLAIPILVGAFLVLGIIINVIYNLYNDWSRETQNSVESYCDNDLNIYKRGSALNLEDSSKWKYWRTRHFNALHPNVNVNWDNPLHKDKMKLMCDIDNQWLGELERKLYLSEEKPESKNQLTENQNLIETTNYCNNLHIKDRLIRSKIELYKFAYHNNSVFLKIYPELKNVNFYAKVSKDPAYLKTWCKVADRWITEQERKGPVTKEPVYADSMQNGLVVGELHLVQNYCLNKYLDERLIISDLNNSTYIKEVDKRFRSEHPDLKGSIERSNIDHVPYIKDWCDIADQWITEQENFKLPKG